jgi:hypothetical protein
VTEKRIALGKDHINPGSLLKLTLLIHNWSQKTPGLWVELLVCTDALKVDLPYSAQLCPRPTRSCMRLRMYVQYIHANSWVEAGRAAEVPCPSGHSGLVWEFWW